MLQKEPWSARTFIVPDPDGNLIYLPGHLIEVQSCAGPRCLSSAAMNRKLYSVKIAQVPDAVIPVAVIKDGP
jgi:hypothetical protein